MPEPSLGDVHVDQALTDFSVAYLQDASGYIASQVSPLVGSPRQSNKYYIYDKSELLRSDAQKRAPNTEAPVRTYSISQGSFFCDVRSIAVDVSEQVRANADPALDPEEDAARVAMQDMLTRMEIDFAAAAMVTGVWGTSSTPSTTWDDASSTPIEDIATGIETIGNNTGYAPNTFVMGAQVAKRLRHHPDIVARLPDNAPRVVQNGFLATLFGVDRVFEARAIRNTADEGATAAYSRVVTNSNALLLYVDPSAGLRQPTAMKTFVWDGLLGSINGFRTKRLEMPWKDALPRVEVDSAYDFVITGSDLGYAFITATAS